MNIVIKYQYNGCWLGAGATSETTDVNRSLCFHKEIQASLICLQKYHYNGCGLVMRQQEKLLTLYCSLCFHKEIQSSLTFQ